MIFITMPKHAMRQKWSIAQDQVCCVTLIYVSVKEKSSPSPHMSMWALWQCAEGQLHIHTRFFFLSHYVNVWDRRGQK